MPLSTTNLAPSSGVIFGSWCRERYPEDFSGGSPVSIEQIHYNFENRIGRQMGLVGSYMHFDDWKTSFPGSYQQRWANGGRLLFFRWKPDQAPGVAKWQDIANGVYDSYLTTAFTNMKNWQGGTGAGAVDTNKFLLAFHHEFDGDDYLTYGNAGDTASQGLARYKAAFNHIRSVRNSVGATNALLCWVVTGGSTFNQDKWLPAYPGDANVDWIGFEPYNLYCITGSNWRWPTENWSAFLNWAQTNAPTPPIMIGEFGVGEHADASGSLLTPSKAEWFRNGTQGVIPTLKKAPYTRIKAISYFNSSLNATDIRCEGWIDSTTDSSNGFITMANDPLMFPDMSVGSGGGGGGASGGTAYNRLIGFFIGTGEYVDVLDSTLCPPNEYAFIGVHWNVGATTLAQLRAQHPNAKFYAYQDFGGMIAGPHSNSRPTSLVSQEDAATHGGGADSWFLHSATAKTITTSTNVTPPVFTTSAVHGLIAEDLVEIWGHSVSAYNGVWRVKTAPTTTTATFKRSDTGADMPAGGAGTGGSLQEIATFCDYTYLAWANISKTSWRTAASQHFAQIAADGFDGIMFDDVNVQPGHCWSDGLVVELATEADYRTAVVGAMATLATAARAQGLKVVANVGVDPWNTVAYAGFTDLLTAGSLDGFIREFWLAWGGGVSSSPFVGSAWTDTVKMLSDAETAGVAAYCNMYQLSPVDHFRSIEYGLASFWLTHNGTAASGFGYNSGKPTSIYGRYRKLLGSPTGAKQLISGTSTDGAWMRYWSGGVACVNAKTSGSTTFTFDGTYINPDGTSVTSLTLAPGYGAVLLSPTGTASSPIAPRAFATGSNTFSTTPIVTVPATTKGGDLIGVFLTTSTTTPTITAFTAGYNLLTTDVVDGTSQRTNIAWKIASGTVGATSSDAGTTVGPTLSATGSKTILFCFVYSGTASAPLTASGVAETTTQTTHTTPSLTTADNGSWVLSIWSDRGTVVGGVSTNTTQWVLPAGETMRGELYLTGSAATTFIASDTNQAHAPGSYGGKVAESDFSNNNAVQWTIIIKPSISSTTPAGSIDIYNDSYGFGSGGITGLLHPGPIPIR